MNSESIMLLYSTKEAIEELDAEKKLMKLNRLLQIITRTLIENKQYDFPTNIPELLTFLKTTPVKQYIHEITQEIYAINEYLNLTEEFIQYLDEENSEEKSQKLMYDLLKLLRQSNYSNKEEIYIELRRLIRYNYYISVRELELAIKSKYDKEIYSKIYNMYEKANDLHGKYELCLVCGRNINLSDSKNGECINKVCNYYIKALNLKSVVKEFKEKMLRLNNGIYKYNLMSSIGEFEIYNRCIEWFKDKNVILYPNVDEYDISIIDDIEAIRVNLDIKDTADPMRLTKILLENTNLEKLKKKEGDTFNFIVIPDHREKIYKLENDKSYTKELNVLLKENNVEVDVICQRHLKNRLIRIFKEV
ncbi:hypothetical protein [Clostridium intestinale]|uniref:REase associating with pPIWI RE domain-containing protein n=1 Tax=Clostridium intestinale URNW TaxID=1294142 RepID=U2NMW3_9CLOT|nr:hypothetical protein [Clostridium intestinale]ERK30498.1 hypothetical protein CINTURNW_2267 [Clostridium intestinale URNW]